ncbi:probable glycoprotein hormone G-protein coupled receptor isoform X3 [Drosophila willistoni]|uniref:probable glycoprotein hormone G-protein coupled receptor isoform X3 n=1 Tax=Drosophila willistoni TaxID=7260 RepID=UPI000C26C458|nr:probable glycoprotein hormone G-protein coupled receptor isoform X3 [Drosophila willistoni]
MGVASMSRRMLTLPLAVALIVVVLSNQVDAYSKYGRGCGDIGCLPTEECVISSDSCSYNQRDGKDCGSFPTCKRKTGSSSASSNHASPSVNPSGSVLNPGYPMHGLQPVNPYNPPFVFGQLPFNGGSPSGTGGPPNGGGGGLVGGGGGFNGMPSSTLGILGGGGGGLAPYGSNYQGYANSHHQNANMYNKPPPQYQNQNQQNPYNRQTQAHPSAAASLISSSYTLGLLVLQLLLLLLRT